ncbi:MAG: tRNA (adenosine(37)-N6)-dimethylallyltransferase MiaA [Alphaproteobacteria bacterium]|nr:tRNA (adenosine(37)-N6)-dimethylallyltransferase MiaA [Alphaproteobacteria bacterium]
MRPAILIHGPTASGKTGLAIALAKRLGGEIVNADAMQVYADLDVLTARPTAAELAEAPHHLFGHVDAATRYSAGAWVKQAAERIGALQSQQKVPVVVGGTGLYLMALTEGLSDIPEIPEVARRDARARVAADARGAHAELALADPVTAARIGPEDRQRVARALEVWLATARPISDYRGAAAPVLRRGEWLGVAFTPQREPLYARINARVDAMMRAGALEEARRLWDRRLDRDLPAMRAHGMPGFSDYFDGKTSLDEAVERCKRDTRRYAKRQFTWIAHQFTLWTRVPAEALDVRARVVAAMWNELQAA